MGRVGHAEPQFFPISPLCKPRLAALRKIVQSMIVRDKHRGRSFKDQWRSACINGHEFHLKTSSTGDLFRNNAMFLLDRIVKVIKQKTIFR